MKEEMKEEMKEIKVTDLNKKVFVEVLDEADELEILRLMKLQRAHQSDKEKALKLLKKYVDSKAIICLQCTQAVLSLFLRLGSWYLNYKADRELNNKRELELEKKAEGSKEIVVKEVPKTPKKKAKTPKKEVLTDDTK